MSTFFSQTLPILLDGLLAGMFVCSSMVEHAMRRLSAAHWIAYKQAKEAVFGPVMPIVFGGVLALSIVLAVLLPTRSSVAVAGLMGVVLAITVAVHIPLNRRFQDWTETDYAVTWDKDRRRWRNWNLLRTLPVVIAYLLVVTVRP